MSAALSRTSAEIAEALVRFHGAIAPAAHALGMAPQTLRRRLKQQPALARVLEDQEAVVSDLAVARVIKAIHAGDVSAAKWWLIRMDRSFSLRRVETRAVHVADWPTEKQPAANQVLRARAGG